MNPKKIVKKVILATGSLVITTSNSLAADISMQTFTDSGSDFWAGLDPIKPTIIKLLAIVIVAYGVSMVAGSAGSGIKVNMAPLINNLELRSQGYKGIIGVFLGLVIVGAVLAMCFSMWNDIF